MAQTGTPPQATGGQGGGLAGFDLKPGEARRLTWAISAAQVGLIPLHLRVTAGDRVLQRTRYSTSVRARDPRREYQARTGDWLLYPPQPTLQQGSAAPLVRIEPRPSAELKRNLFGITAHLPRSVNDEDLFVADHAVGGDLSTCWASRWWRIAVPFEPEWLQVDMGRVARMEGVDLLPAWHGGSFPAAPGRTSRPRCRSRQVRTDASSPLAQGVL